MRVAWRLRLMALFVAGVLAISCGGGAGGSSSGGAGGSSSGGVGGAAGTGGAGGGCPPGQVWCTPCGSSGACYSGSTCPGFACPATTCDQVTTEAACDTRTDCHSVYVDPGTCGCASVGCCAHFSRCAAGDHGQCTMPSTFGCAIATPYCESPAYVVSYTSSCYEGCVRADDCAP
jgi:hypothetical protein